MTDTMQAAVAGVLAGAPAPTPKPEELVQLVVFELDGEEYAVPIGDLTEIVKLPAITPLPGAPECLRGIINLRGKIAVVVDLERRFQLIRQHPPAAPHLIIAEVARNLYGVLVDRVREVIRVPITSIETAPSLASSKIHADYINGVLVIKHAARDRVLLVINLRKLLEEKELLAVGTTVAQAAATSHA